MPKVRTTTLIIPLLWHNVKGCDQLIFLHFCKEDMFANNHSLLKRIQGQHLLLVTLLSQKILILGGTQEFQIIPSGNKIIHPTPRWNINIWPRRTPSLSPSKPLYHSLPPHGPFFYREKELPLHKPFLQPWWKCLKLPIIQMLLQIDAWGKQLEYKVVLIEMV